MTIHLGLYPFNADILNTAILDADILNTDICI